MRFNRITYLVTFLVGICVVNLVLGGGLAGGLLFRTSKFYTVLEDKALVFAKAVTSIQEHYIREVKAEELVYGAVEGMIASLEDQNCSFIPPKEYKHFQEATQGKFGGLGIKIEIGDSGVLTVNQVLAGKPADLAGVKDGDKIIAIDGVSTVGMDEGDLLRRVKSGIIPFEEIRRFIGITLPEAVDKLRGLVNTEVTITVKREGEEPQDIDIIRKEIELDSVQAEEVKMIEKGIGYVRLSAFTERSREEMESAFDQLEEEGMEALILDLRRNGGGLLGAAVDVADMFIPAGKLIVYTEGRDKKEISRRVASRRATRKPYRLVVLVNEFSASGAEIVAGAIQDWERGILVGAKTFGKGSVQNVIPLPDDSGLRLTTALYYTPKGRCIDGEGIVPDFPVAAARRRFSAMSTSPLDERRVREMIRQEMKGEEKEETAPSDEEQEDPQLERALEILKSWEVFANVLDMREKARDRTTAEKVGED